MSDEPIETWKRPISQKMVCPVCHQLGWKSQLFHAGFMNYVPHLQFWDEDGVYHSHVVDHSREFYQCSNNHILEKIFTERGMRCMDCRLKIDPFLIDESLQYTCEYELVLVTDPTLLDRLTQEIYKPNDTKIVVTINNNN